MWTFSRYRLSYLLIFIFLSVIYLICYVVKIRFLALLYALVMFLLVNDWGSLRPGFGNRSWLVRAAILSISNFCWNRSTNYHRDLISPTWKRRSNYQPCAVFSHNGTTKDGSSGQLHLIFYHKCWRAARTRQFRLPWWKSKSGGRSSTALL